MVKGMKGDPKNCPSFGMSNGPQLGNPESEEEKQPSGPRISPKKAMDSRIVSIIGVSLAASEVATMIYTDYMNPWLTLVFTVSSAAYCTCAMMTYMSDLEGWTEWPIVTITCMLVTFMPPGLSVGYDIPFPRNTSDNLMVQQAVFGPTLYLIICCVASKLNDEEEKSEQKLKQKELENLVAQQKDNMRQVMSHVDQDGIRDAIQNAVEQYESKQEEPEQEK